MDFNTPENIAVCSKIVQEASALLLYSHIPTALIALALGVFVLVKNNSIVSRLLFYITLSFLAWCTIDLVVWFSYDNSTLLMFAWSLYGLIFTSIFITSLYFIYVFFDGKDISFKLKTILAMLCLPVIFLTPTTKNLVGYNNTECIAKEGTMFTNYYLFLGLFIALWIAILAISRYMKSRKADERKQIFLVTTGMELFLLNLFLTIFGITYLLDVGYITNGNYNLEQYGLFGMPIFIGFLSYIIVKFKSFNLKIIGAQALVIFIWFALFAVLFVRNLEFTRYIVLITLVLVGILGVILVRGVKKERAQLEKIQELAKDLEKANVRLKALDKEKTELVSLASHQLRAPMTAIKGYISMIFEGDYGEVPKVMMDPIKRIFTSTQSLVQIVGDFLDVSRIELGTMKFNFTDFDLKCLVSQIVEELKPNIEISKLEFKFESPDEKFPLHGDETKLKQVFNNLIDNSLKYTKKGSVHVSLNKEGDRYIFKVKDTGIGMQSELIPKLFDKFTRASNANEANVIGTGLGLYVAKQMVEKHNGKIWAESEGEGKGSTFVVEIPIVSK